MKLHFRVTVREWAAEFLIGDWNGGPYHDWHCVGLRHYWLGILQVNLQYSFVVVLLHYKIVGEGFYCSLAIQLMMQLMFFSYMLFYYLILLSPNQYGLVNCRNTVR